MTSTHWLRLVLVLGFVLRLARPEVHSFWIDEGMTILQAQSSDLLRTLRDDSHPPLSFLLVRAWGGLFGWSDFALRLLPAFVSCASLALFVPLARAWLGVDRAIWAVALYAFAPLLVWIAHEVRMYAFVELAALLVLHTARWAWKAPAVARWALLALGISFATGLHYYGALSGLVVIAQALVRRMRGSLSTGAVAATAVAAAIGVAVWIPLFATLLPAQATNGWPRIALFSWRDLAETPARLVGVDFIALVEHRVAWIGWALGALCTLGIAIAIVRGVSRRSEVDPEMLAAALVPIGAALVLAATAEGGFQPRYLIVAVPGAIACIAAGLLLPRAPRPARAAMASLVTCAFAMSVLQLSDNRREDYRSACREIAERWQTGDRLLVVCCVPRSLRFSTVDHYLRDRPEIMASAIDQDDDLAGASGARLHVLWREATICRDPFDALRRARPFDEEEPARFRIHRALTRLP